MKKGVLFKPTLLNASMQARMTENSVGEAEKSFHLVILVGVVTFQRGLQIIERAMDEHISGGALQLGLSNPEWLISWASPYRKIARGGTILRPTSGELAELACNLNYSANYNDGIISLGVEIEQASILYCRSAGLGRSRIT